MPLSTDKNNGMKKYTIGIDFGTLSGRALLLDAEDGREIAFADCTYPHGVMDTQLEDGTPLPPLFALQHPSDYIEVLRTTIPEVLKKAQVSPEEVVGIGIDFTSCTLLPIDRDGTPLCLRTEFQNEPHAYVKLWKHHAAQSEADQINEAAEEVDRALLQNYGGRINAEWALPKILEILHHAPAVFEATHRFMEAGDWISLVLTGKESHSAGFAGFKFLWNDESGFPTDRLLQRIDPRLCGLFEDRVSKDISPVGGVAGHLSADGARLTGLCEGTMVAIPLIDAFAPAAALQVTELNAVLMTVGTSAVQIVHAEEKLDVPGICGVAKESVIPSLYTYEAGQTGVGDSFDWFVRNCVPTAYTEEAVQKGMSIHTLLREKASLLPPGSNGLLALDWINGNRSLLQDAELSCMILGMTLRTRPEEIWRALIEATAFGLRRILENFEAHGLPIRHLFATGGIAKKDDMLMQIYADVCACPIRVAMTDQGPARGSAIYAAVAAKLYPDVRRASEQLAVKDWIEYTPIKENTERYALLYDEYCRLYEYFGRENPDMKRLKEI